MRPALRALAGLGALGLTAMGIVPALPQAPGVGLANPASVNCGRLGGRTEIRNGPQGQFGVCMLPDGRVCEEWALFRDGRCVRPPD